MTDKAFTDTETFALDVAKRTVYTALEAGATTAAVTFPTLGSSTHAAYITAIAAVGSAALAAVRSSLAQAFSKNGQDRAEGQYVLAEDFAVVKDRVDKLVSGLGTKSHELTATTTYPTVGSAASISSPPLVTGTATQGWVTSMPEPDVTAHRPQPGPAPAPSVPETDDDDEAAADTPALPAEPEDDDAVPAAAAPAVIVYDANGNALGVVDPAKIQNGESA